MQALKLVRTMVRLQASALPATITHSVNACANARDDNMRRVALETLREIALRNPKICASCFGFHTLVDSVLDSTCADQATAIVLTMVYIMNEEHGRGFLDPRTVIRTLMAPLMSTTSVIAHPGHFHKPGVANAAAVLQVQHRQ